MPIPTPQAGEDKNSFISRCMGSRLMVDEYDQKQRAAVCHSAWRQKLKNNRYMKIMDSILAVNRDAVPVRKEIMDGQEYTVVPVVMLQEGVYSGSSGPILYTAEELSKFASAWDGIPIPVNHPVDNAGNFVSCNKPVFYSSQVVGQVFNTQFTDNKLKAELWLKNSKLETYLPDFVSKIHSGSQVEVSTGVFFDAIAANGEVNGVQYSAIAKGLKPDHLAILTDEKGACSYADGCGIRTNEKGADMPENVVDNMAKCCPEQVDEVIKNSKIGFAEDDREFLSNMTQEHFDRLMVVMTSVKPEKNENQDEKEPVMNAEPKKIESLEELIANSTQDFSDQVQKAMAILSDQKKTLMDKIMANKANRFSEEDLKGFDMSVLENISAFADVPAVANFAGNAGSPEPVMNAKGEAPLPDPEDYFKD